MLCGRGGPLILAAALLAGRAVAAQVDYVGTYVWRGGDEDFGGFSAIELSDDGARYWALSDRGTIRWGSIERDDSGRIRGLTDGGRARLRDSKDRPLDSGWIGDAEGLARAPDGTLWVSFEGLHRIARYDDPDGPATRIPSPPEFAVMEPNAGLEALAITAEGALLAIPEKSPGAEVEIWRWQDGAWDRPYRFARDARWRPVGADIGPDGRLYLLERDFRGLGGFASRVRRFDLAPGSLGAGEVLMESAPLQYDNLEGISVWKDAQGLRLTMISDDNFLFLQRTELVEIRVRD